MKNILVIGLGLIGSYLISQNNKAAYSYFLQKQVDLLEQIQGKLEHMRFHNLSEVTVGIPLSALSSGV